MSKAGVDEFRKLLAGRDRDERPSIEEQRAGYEAIGGAFPIKGDCIIEPVNANGVKAEWTTFEKSNNKIIMYLHGGGYVIGSLISHRPLVADISRSTQRKILAVDYRLAPEHPFPAAVDDAVTSYQWLLSEGYQASDIAIAGDSAGGGLTIACMLKLKDLGIPLPEAGICLSPWVDMEANTETMISKADIDPMVQQETLRGMAAIYLNGANPTDPLTCETKGITQL